MNICLKVFCVLYATIIGFGCALVTAGPTPDSSTAQIQQCYDARSGKLDLKSIDYSDPQNNSFLFNCAVAVSIPDPIASSGEGKNKKQRDAEKEKRTMIADFFLSKEMDVTYRNEYGDTLLMSVVLSFMPDEWKERTAKALIEKGVDIKSQNSDGDTALDLAKRKKNENLIKLLSEKFKK